VPVRPESKNFSDLQNIADNVEVLSEQRGASRIALGLQERFFLLLLSLTPLVTVIRIFGLYVAFEGKSFLILFTVPSLVTQIRWEWRPISRQKIGIWMDLLLGSTGYPRWPKPGMNATGTTPPR
jgi:hypothetical protein